MLDIKAHWDEMSNIHEIYFATSNPGKFEEVKNYLSFHAPEITLKQFDGDIPEIQTLNQKVIALDKARKAWNILKKPVLVDDSGIYFAKYKDFPGTLTKFIHNSIGFSGIFKLIANNEAAYFKLYMVYMDGPESYKIVEGINNGKIIHNDDLQAPEGLPWDAVFVPNGETRTYQELIIAKELEKHSYRINALKKFLLWYTAK